jgi:hypothetical protein
MPEISRDQIRRLDDASKEVLERLMNGPLGAEERHASARSLVRLLPLVADDLQDREQKKAADKRLEHLQRCQVEAESSGRLDVVDRPETSAQSESAET